jgi:hypothetical protein
MDAPAHGEAGGAVDACSWNLESLDAPGHAAEGVAGGRTPNHGAGGALECAILGAMERACRGWRARWTAACFTRGWSAMDACSTSWKAQWTLLTGWRRDGRAMG